MLDHKVIEQRGDVALLKLSGNGCPYVVASGYDPDRGDWSQGHYCDTIEQAILYMNDADLLYEIGVTRVSDAHEVPYLPGDLVWGLDDGVAYRVDRVTKEGYLVLQDVLGAQFPLDYTHDPSDLDGPVEEQGPKSMLSVTMNRVNAQLAGELGHARALEGWEERITEARVCIQQVVLDRLREPDGMDALAAALEVGGEAWLSLSDRERALSVFGVLDAMTNCLPIPDLCDTGFETRLEEAVSMLADQAGRKDPERGGDDEPER